MVCIAFWINRILSPHKPNPEKLSSYECGEEPEGSSWIPFNSRFYVIALVFLLFDVEMIFIFPCTIVFGSRTMNQTDPRWSGLALAEMFIFLGILILGLVYVWVKGDLDWIKPQPVKPVADTNIPHSLYDDFNERQSGYTVKPFQAERAEPAGSLTDGSAAAPIRKPMFKPAFKKPDHE